MHAQRTGWSDAPYPGADRRPPLHDRLLVPRGTLHRAAGWCQGHPGRNRSCGPRHARSHPLCVFGHRAQLSRRVAGRGDSFRSRAGHLGRGVSTLTRPAPSVPPYGPRGRVRGTGNHGEGADDGRGRRAGRPGAVPGPAGGRRAAGAPRPRLTDDVRAPAGPAARARTLRARPAPADRVDQGDGRGPQRVRGAARAARPRRHRGRVRGPDQQAPFGARDGAGGGAGGRGGGRPGSRSSCARRPRCR